MPTPDDLDLDTPMRVSRAAVATSIPGETVILDPATGRYFGLDGVGAHVWELLQTPTSLGRMIETILEEYDVDNATCEHELRALLHELEAKGLVTRE